MQTNAYVQMTPVSEQSRSKMCMSADKSDPKQPLLALVCAPKRLLLGVGVLLVPITQAWTHPPRRQTQPVITHQEEILCQSLLWLSGVCAQGQGPDQDLLCNIRGPALDILFILNPPCFRFRSRSPSQAIMTTLKTRPSYVSDEEPPHEL